MEKAAKKTDNKAYSKNSRSVVIHIRQNLIFFGMQILWQTPDSIQNVDMGCGYVHKFCV